MIDRPIELGDQRYFRFIDNLVGFPIRPMTLGVRGASWFWF
jgi:hypothetical protein